MSGPVRLSDVAEAAGVSLGTASNTFNRPDLVRAEVREQVEAAARRLGYSGPNPKGRLLMGAKANAIGVLPAADMSVADIIGNPFLRDFLTGIGEVCDEKGANLLLVSGAGDRKDQAIRNALVDGFILGHVDEVEAVLVRQRQVPFVVMDMDAGPDASSVRFDGRAGARLAADHLLSLGHRRFAILAVLRKAGDPIWYPPAKSDRRLVAAYPLDEDKLLGYQDALASAGISINDVPIVQCHLGSQASDRHQPTAEAGARMILDRAPEATAILSMSDTNAVALLKVARGRGIVVPRDLSVVGFDDGPNAAGADPPLTTISQSTVEKGRIAARILFEGGPPRHEIMPVKLIVRASTTRPRA